MVPDTIYNPLKELSVKTCFSGGGSEIGQVFLWLQSLKLNVARQNAYYQQD